MSFQAWEFFCSEAPKSLPLIHTEQNPTDQLADSQEGM